MSEHVTPGAPPSPAERVRAATVGTHASVWLGIGDLKRAMASRLDVRDERGDVAARTVGIAIMAALAIAIGGIITTKVTDKAQAIDLDAGP